MSRRERAKEKRKLNFRKYGRQMAAIAFFFAIAVGVALYFYANNTIAATSKPSVYIVDRDYVANTSSGERMRVYLQGQGYSVTVKNATAGGGGLPTHATANGYDVIIYSSGNLGTATLTDTDLQWIYDQMNGAGNNHRMIVEGDSVLSEMNISASKATFETGVLHGTVGATLRTTTPYTFNRVDAAHYVLKGTTTGTNITATNPSYTNYATNGIRPFTSGAGSTLLYKYTNTVTAPYDILTAWEGANRSSREVLMAFVWYDGTYGILGTGAQQTWREGLLKNSVDWLGEFVELASFTNMAPANVNPGSTINMGRVRLQNSIGGENTTLTGFSLQQTGTATLDSNVSAVKIYDDANNDGIIDTPGTPLDTSTFSGGVAAFNGLSLAIPSGGRSIIITYDVAAGAEGRKTLKAKVDTASFTNQEGALTKIVAGTYESSAVTINDITPPAVPTGVIVTSLGTGTGLRISWNANSDTDIAGYNVYRDSTPSGSFNTLVANVPIPTTSYNNTGLTQFTNYYYKVTAYDVSGNNTAKSSSAAVLGIPNAPPNTPAGPMTVSDPGTGGTLNISWPAHAGEPVDPNYGSADLAGYNLYISLASGGPYSKANSSLIAAVSNPTYKQTGLTNGTTYYFKISTVDRYGLESSLSAVNGSNTPTDITPPNIISLYPAEGQNRVAKNSVIKVTVDDALNPASVNSSTLTLKDSNNQVISGNVLYDVYNHEVRFTPDNPLPPAGTFTAILLGASPNGIKNLSGAGLYLGYDKQWTFGTLINPHINFNTNNALCGYCHSAHTANGNNIIRAPKILDLCLLCHDGTGSSYDVKSGIYFNGDNPTPLLSGGYDLAMGSTSTHFTDLANYVYGGPQSPMTVDCNNCHEPHGTSNYRNLRTVVNGIPVTVTGVVYGPAYSVKTASGAEVATYVYGINQFCGACHFDYLVYNSENTRDGQINWRHRIGVNLTGGSTDGDFVINYPLPGLYTTLPTEGAPTGANVNKYDIMPGGTLGIGTYNYIVTGKNAVGESVYGSIIQVTTSAVNRKIKIQWEPIANAYKYRVYRYIGALDIRFANPNSFNFLAETADYPTSFTDDGSYAPQAVHPPTTSSASINCLTCHYSHGTRATAEEPTRLRRFDNNGVCQDCHKK